MLQTIKINHTRNNDANEFLTFGSFVEDFNYHSFRKIRVMSKGKTYNGYLYMLSNPNEKTIEKYKSRFRNVAFVTSRKQYAPELKTRCIFIANKTIY